MERNMRFDGELLTVKDNTGTVSVPVEKHGDFYYLPKNKDFMDLLWVMEGRTPFGWKKVIYVFHTQEYLDIIDPL